MHYNGRSMPFTCSICEQESTRICVTCTKDTCDNHLCEKCHQCSDCCECEVALIETTETVTEQAASALVGGTEPLFGSNAALEPAGVPAEHVAGQAADENLS